MEIMASLVEHSNSQPSSDNLVKKYEFHEVMTKESKTT